MVTQGPAGGQHLARYQERKIAVNVCGRTLGVPEACGTLMSLQATLQDELGMPDQVFEVFDNSGTRLLVDGDLREAAAENRLPLSATLSDASIHFIENRREELAQMQWKLVRDQHNQASSKLAVFSRQLQEMESKMESHARGTQQALQAMRTEFQLAIEGVKDLTMNNSRQLSERIAGIGQLVQAERNMREVAVEKLGKSVQSIHDTIDGHRSAVRQGNDVTMTHVEGARRLIDAERDAREALEDKCERGLEHMGLKMEEVASSLKNAMGEYSRLFEQASAESGNASEKHLRTAQKHRTELDAAHDAMNHRMKLLEERSNTIESRLNEQHRRHADTVDKLAQRHEKVSTHLDVVKFTGDQHTQNTEAMMKRIQELEASLCSTDQHVKEITEKERRQRMSEMASLKEAISSEQERMRSNIEGRIQTKAVGESHAREEMRQQIMESLSSAMGQQRNSGGDWASEDASRGDPQNRGMLLPIGNAPANTTGSLSVPLPAHGSMAVKYPGAQPVALPVPPSSVASGRSPSPAVAMASYGAIPQPMDHRRTICVPSMPAPSPVMHQYMHR